MIEIIYDGDDAVAGIKAEGWLSHYDYEDVLVPYVEEKIQKNGPVRLLCLMDASFKGWKFQAVRDEISFALRHRQDFEKTAIVGGPEWLKSCAKLSAPFMKGEFRFFPSDRLYSAQNWVMH